jgi:hypothetical protein
MAMARKGSLSGGSDTTGTTGGAGAAVDASNRIRREGETDIDAATTEGIDTSMAGSKPGMVSQADMDASGDSEELRRQRRDNINPSQPIVPEKPV